MLMEQIYRAQDILQNGDYHRWKWVWFTGPVAEVTLTVLILWLPTFRHKHASKWELTLKWHEQNQIVKSRQSHTLNYGKIGCFVITTIHKQIICSVYHVSIHPFQHILCSISNHLLKVIHHFLVVII